MRDEVDVVDVDVDVGLVCCLPRDLLMLNSSVVRVL